MASKHIFERGVMPVFNAPPSGRPEGLHVTSDTERNQAIVRVAIACIAEVYILIKALFNIIAHQEFLIIGGLFFGVILSSLVLLFFIWRFPGVYHARRAFAMAHDYGALTLTLAIGSESILPLYAVLLWVTVGNGLRFGPRYLAAATLCALASLAIITLYRADWRAQPSLVSTLFLTTLIVPVYAQSLLRGTRAANDAANAANRAKSRFLAQASHDLRQPIHAIGLMTASLNDSTLDARQRATLDRIETSLQGLSRLFRSLLDVTSLDSGAICQREASVAMQDILSRLRSQNMLAARQAGITLRFVPCRLWVRTDPELLSTILQNIMSNAIKYAPGQAVLIGCRRRGATLSVEVHDQGPGIAQANLPMYLMSFIAAKPDRMQRQTGWG